jgi:hypothetical protein
VQERPPTTYTYGRVAVALFRRADQYEGAVTKRVDATLENLKFSLVGVVAHAQPVPQTALPHVLEVDQMVVDSLGVSSGVALSIAPLRVSTLSSLLFVSPPKVADCHDILRPTALAEE